MYRHTPVTVNFHFVEHLKYLTARQPLLALVLVANAHFLAETTCYRSIRRRTCLFPRSNRVAHSCRMLFHGGL